MQYSSLAYEYLFNQELSASSIQNLGNDLVFRYRTKTIKSGPVLECEIYPIWNTRAEARKAKEAVTREAQKAVNDRNAKKQLNRLVNTNFDENDVCITLTYAPDCKTGSVPDARQAQKDIRNYIRRIRDYRKKHDLPEMKYVYVMEYDDGENGKGKKRVHHHLIVSGGMDRDALEKLWGKGWANSKRLQPDDYGLEALSRYIIKDQKCKKRWYGSRNLKHPKVTISDTKISRRKAMRIAEEVNEAPATIFHKAYPGYELNDLRIRDSEFVSGMYIYARMRKARKGWLSVPATNGKKKPMAKKRRFVPKQESLFDWEREGSESYEQDCRTDVE